MNILKNYNLKPSKRLGQNFLTDKAVIKKVIKSADLKSNDVVLEIGPGFGVLTKEIAKTAKRVIAVEKDIRLCSILKEMLKDYNDIEVIRADALKDNYKLPTINYKLISNLPFYITAPAIRKFLNPSAGRPPKEMILIVQKEMAQRIVAKPPNMSILAVSVQVYAKPEIISYISKNSFYPKPKVDSAIIRIIPQKIQKPPKEFFKIVRAGFSSPRKQLINNLSKSLNIKKEKIIKWLKENNIDPTRRAETLSTKEWIKLTNTF